MAEYGIFTKGSVIGEVITLDATLAETHQLGADVTMFPVETGSDITDHVRAKPLTLALQGLVTATPLTGEGEGGNDRQRLARAHDALLEAARLGEPLVVITGLTHYENLVIQNYTARRDAALGRALDVTLDLVQVRRVDEVEVDLPPARLQPTTVRPDGQSAVDAGTQTGIEPTQEEANEAASGLWKLTHGEGFVAGFTQAAGGLFF